MEAAIDATKRVARIKSIFGGLIALVVLGGIGYFVAQLRVETAAPTLKWTEDPKLPQMIYAVAHDHRGDRHGVGLLCMDMGRWATQQKAALDGVPSADRGKYLEELGHHWEAIENARFVVASWVEAADATAVMTPCASLSGQLGQYIHKLQEGTEGDGSQFTVIGAALRDAVQAVPEGGATRPAAAHP